MIYHARVFRPSAFILTLSVGCLHIAMAGEHVGSGGPDATSAFASETRLLNDTNESYGRRAGVDFPDDPSDYFSRVQSAREMLRMGDCTSAVLLLEQATQESAAYETFGFAPRPYRPDQAISDLLAILDDRIESEGVQVGLPHEFLHQMWTLCNSAQELIGERVWMETNIDGITKSKAAIRELTYRALIEYMETDK